MRYFLPVCLAWVVGARNVNFRELRYGEVRRIILPRTSVNKGIKKGRAPKEPDPRLASHYYRIDRRTVVMRLLVPAALMTSSVPVANSVPRYFMCLRAVLTT